MPVNKAFQGLGFYKDSSDPLGSFILEVFSAGGFIRDDQGVYHAKFDCPQAEFGYNDYYDKAFKVGTSAMQAKFPFSYTYQDENGISVEQDLILWAWKGDYLNLGAGAELGIYKASENVHDIGTEHWDVDKNLALNMELVLEYTGNNKEYRSINNGIIANYKANHWWITAFKNSVNASNWTFEESGTAKFVFSK